MWSNLDDGPDLSTNVAKSVHLRCRKITHGAQHLLTCCTAYTTSSHLAPCAISGTKAKRMACGATRAASTSTFCVKHLQSFIEFAEDTYTNKFKALRASTAVPFYEREIQPAPSGIRS